MSDYVPAAITPPLPAPPEIADLPEGESGYVRSYGFLVDASGAVWVEGHRGFLPQPYDGYQFLISRLDGHVVMESLPDPERMMAWDNMEWASQALRAERVYLRQPEPTPPARQRPGWFRWLRR